MNPSAAPRRRIFLSILWLVIGSVIAAALIKLAFFNAPNTSALEPTGVLEAPLVTVTEATVVNSFFVSGSVVADAGIPVRATEQGTVTEVFVTNGDRVERDQALFEVREQIGETEPEQITAGDPETGEGARFSEPEPIYQYFTVHAPTSGMLNGFTPLPKMTVSIGEEVGQIGPGTFTVVADLTAAMQYRMLDRPASATVSIPGGPAPFDCTSLEIGAPVAPDAPPAQPDPYAYEDPYAFAGGDSGGTVTDQIRCAVPEGERVFAGLTAEVEVVAGIAEDVLVVPVTAVRGDYATGIVYLPSETGEEPMELQIQLGLTDGLMVEVVDGLESGQLIHEYVPTEEPFYEEYGHEGGF